MFKLGDIVIYDGFRCEISKILGQQGDIVKLKMIDKSASSIDKQSTEYWIHKELIKTDTAYYREQKLNILLK